MTRLSEWRVFHTREFIHKKLNKESRIIKITNDCEIIFNPGTFIDDFLDEISKEIKRSININEKDVHIKVKDKIVQDKYRVSLSIKYIIKKYENHNELIYDDIEMDIFLIKN